MENLVLLQWVQGDSACIQLAWTFDSHSPDRSTSIKSSPLFVPGSGHTFAPGQIRALASQSQLDKFLICSLVATISIVQGRRRH